MCQRLQLRRVEHDSSRNGPYPVLHAVRAPSHRLQGHLIHQLKKHIVMICNDFYYHIRDGANTGFHEAIGELMAMASSTPRHLFDVGLMSELVEDDQVRSTAM